MNLDFNSLTQDEKFKAYACIAAIVSFFLPWWSFSAEYNLLGQSSSVSTSVNGLNMNNSVVGIGASVAALYFILQGYSHSLWASIVCVLYAANVYFNWTGGASFNLSLGKDSPFSAGMNGAYNYGFYIFAASSAILLFFEVRQSGITINSGSGNAEDVPSNTVTDPANDGSKSS